MAQITYIESDGTKHSIELDNGRSVMQGAISNMIKGISAECGGNAACGQCHCYVDEAWLDKTGLASEVEKHMLQFNTNEIKQTSRLSCQIKANDTLNGLMVYVPEPQY